VSGRSPSSDERVLRYIAGIVAISVVGTIALAEVIVNHQISPGVLAILGGPVVLVITMMVVARNGKE